MSTVMDIITSFTGIAGMVTGGLALWKSSQVKSLDLRLELRQQLGSAHHALRSLPELLDYADGSRRRILAQGGQAGAALAWEQDLAADRAEITNIAAEVRDEDADFDALPDKQLEAAIAATHKQVLRLEAFVSKYRDAVAADDNRRRDIRREQADLARPPHPLNPTASPPPERPHRAASTRRAPSASAPCRSPTSAARPKRPFAWEPCTWRYGS